MVGGGCVEDAQLPFPRVGVAHFRGGDLREMELAMHRKEGVLGMCYILCTSSSV
jgi:hypothetical protein